MTSENSPEVLVKVSHGRTRRKTAARAGGPVERPRGYLFFGGRKPDASHRFLARYKGSATSSGDTPHVESPLRPHAPINVQTTAAYDRSGRGGWQSESILRDSSPARTGPDCPAWAAQARPTSYPAVTAGGRAGGNRRGRALAVATSAQRFGFVRDRGPTEQRVLRAAPDTRLAAGHPPGGGTLPATKHEGGSARSIPLGAP